MYKHIEVPKDGQPIKIKNRKLVVPNRPIIPVIEGENRDRLVGLISRQEILAAYDRELLREQ